MKSRTLTCFIAMTLFAALAIPVPLSAQHTRFKLIDLGTPGGPNSYPTIAGPGIRFLNDAGTVAGWGDTTALTPPALETMDYVCSRIPFVGKMAHGPISGLFPARTAARQLRLMRLAGF